MQKISFEDTTVVKSPYVTIDGVEYSVESGTYQGGTDLNANTFNTMQDNIENAINSIELSGGGDEVGTVKMFSGSTAPQGWLICDGSAISRTEYAELFSAIGTTYGSGDGSTTFNIPNIEGRNVVGLDSNDTDFDTLGETGGSKYLQEHTHGAKVNDGTAGGIGNGYPANANNYNFVISQNVVQSAGTGDSGNLQPYIVLNYIIKASATTTTQGQIIDSLNGNSTTDAPSQRAVNTLKPVVLYNDTSGTNGNIQLSDSASNYSYLEIYYNRNNLGYSSMKIDTNYMTDVSLVTSYFQSDILRFYVSNISISGTTITRNYSRYLNATASTSSSTMTSDDDNYFYINKVIGYI